MKCLVSILCLAAALLGFCHGSLQAQTTVTGRISAEIVDVIITTAIEPGGSFIVQKSITSDTDANLRLTDQSIIPATFSICCPSDAIFVVNLPVQPTALTGSKGVCPMTITEWTASSIQAGDSVSSPGGRQQVTIGATLKRGSMEDSAIGTYTGSYEITFAYN